MQQTAQSAIENKTRTTQNTTHSMLQTIFHYKLAQILHENLPAGRSVVTTIGIVNQSVDQVLLQRVQGHRAVLQPVAGGHVMVSRTAESFGPDVVVGEQLLESGLVWRFGVEEKGQTERGKS
jgi:hypothetical protein